MNVARTVSFGKRHDNGNATMNFRIEENTGTTWSVLFYCANMKEAKKLLASWKLKTRHPARELRIVRN
jgi:hypothetical protein